MRVICPYVTIFALHYIRLQRTTILKCWDKCPQPPCMDVYGTLYIVRHYKLVSFIKYLPRINCASWY